MKEDSISTKTSLLYRLPRPLALRWRKFLREEARWKQGNGSSNFDFVVASVCGLSVRFLAALVLGEYLHGPEEKDPHLFLKIRQRLGQPSDGSWLWLLDEVIKVQASNPKAKIADRVAGCLHRKRDVSWRRKSTTARVLLQKMVEYRNHLLHGTKKMNVSATQLAVRQTKTIIETLEPVFSEGVLLAFNGEETINLCGVDTPNESQFFPMGDGLDDCTAHIGWEANSSSKDKDVQLWNCFWQDSDSHMLVFLGPLLWFTTTEGRGQWMDSFFNGYHGSNVEYVSYTRPMVKSAQALGLSSERVLQFLSVSSELSIPGESRMDLDDFAEQYTRIFVGRKRVLSAMMKFCTSDTGRLGILTSPPGLGKTALFAKLYQKWRRDQRWPKKVVPFWVFFSPDDELAQPVRFFQSMLVQMDEWSGSEPKDYSSKETLLQKEWSLRWEAFLASQPGKNVVLFLDGGDMEGEKESSVWDFLPRPIKRRGRRFSILMSFRTESSRLRQRLQSMWKLAPEHCIEIQGASPLSGLSLEDIASAFPYQKRTQQGQLALEKLARIAQMGGDSIHADPGLVRFVLSTFFSGQLDWLQVDKLPRSLHQAYEVVWQRWPIHHHFILQRMMGLLCLLKGYVSDTMLSRLLQLHGGLSIPEAQVTPSAVAELRSVVNAHLLFRQKHFRIWHDSLRDFLLHQFHPRDIVEVLYKPILLFCTEKPKSIDQRQYQLRWSVAHHAECLRFSALDEEEVESVQDSLWSLVWNDQHWASAFQEDLSLNHLWNDWSRLSQSFQPNASETRATKQTWRSLGRSFHIAKRAHFVMSQKELVTQKGLKKKAQNEDWEGLLECIESGPTPYHKEWLTRLASLFVAEHAKRDWSAFLAERGLPLESLG